MIDFGLSEEQTALQAAARELLTTECPPALVRETAKSADGVPRGLYRRMAEQGWFGLLVPEREGGVGLGVLDLALLLEEVGRAAVPGPFLSTRLVVGEVFGALAYLEESDRHDPAGVTATARRTRSGWRLAGTKLFALEAPGAQVLLVAARTRAGVSLFLVERTAPGLRVRAQETVDLTRRLGEVVLDDVEVGREALVGPEGGGWALLARLLDLACVGVAADSLGGAGRVLEMAVGYAQVREQFGRKIGSFQAIKHLLAEMVAEVEPARSLVWYAAYTLDRRPREAPRLAAMAKASLGDIYSRTARRAVEVHGGIGFTWEHDLHLWFKRAHLSEALFGDPRFHRERLATIDGY